MEIQGTLGEEKIENGTRIVTTDEFILYRPSKRTIELHEVFLKWYSCYAVDGVIENIYI